MGVVGGDPPLPGPAPLGSPTASSPAISRSTASACSGRVSTLSTSPTTGTVAPVANDIPSPCRTVTTRHPRDRPASAIGRPTSGEARPARTSKAVAWALLMDRRRVSSSRARRWPATTSLAERLPTTWRFPAGDGQPMPPGPASGPPGLRRGWPRPTRSPRWHPRPSLPSPRVAPPTPSGAGPGWRERSSSRSSVRARICSMSWSCCATSRAFLRSRLARPEQACSTTLWPPRCLGRVQHPAQARRGRVRRMGTRSRIASSSGSSRQETARSAPTRVPFTISCPSARTAATIRSRGRPRTCFSKISRARSWEVSSPLGIGLAGTGATTMPLVLHPHVLAYHRRR